MINTLILSGGSSKGIAYIGIFQSLFYNNIINIDNIKYIISCSAGSIFSLMAVDESTGIVYFPTSAPALSYDASLRPGPNLYTNSIVALDASTGKMIW